MKKNKRTTIAIMLGILVIAILSIVIAITNADTKKLDSITSTVMTTTPSSIKNNNDKTSEKVTETTVKETEEKVDNTTTEKNTTVVDAENDKKEPSEKTTNKNNTDTTAATTQNNSATNTHNTNPAQPDNKKKDWFDNSILTGSQADVGKVVGYTSLLKQDIIVTSVVEGVSTAGLKFIETTYSNGTVSAVVECKYCHNFPCLNGGGINCPQYNAQNDAAVTCQICGRPIGNGYNGTCQNLTDWANGGTISCNHYD